MQYMKIVAAAAVTLVAAVTATTADAAQTPFYAIDHQAIKTPAGVQPWLPTFTPDGRAIVFQSQLDGTTWTVPAHGGTASCVTCSFEDRPAIRGGFTYAFDDNKRLFVSHELGGTGGVDSGKDADAWILECAPSVRDCKRHKYLPVDMSADKGGDFIVQRRTWHLAPDGVHLAWSEIRLDGTIMVIAKLRRAGDRYVADDQRVVNPVGPTSPTDTDPQHWENASQLYELKSFADNGKAILALAERGLNTDVLKIDLATGKTTRFTGNPDWDEDGAISPDGALDVLYSWRTRNRLDALGTIPQLRGFDSMGIAAAVAPFYVSTWTGFQCDLSPWLLPGGGDADGTVVGQPLNTYGDGLTPGNNLSGQQFWSPDSTSVLLQERTTTRPPEGVNEHVAQKGLTPRRVRVAHIRRPAGKARRAATTRIGAWAPAPTAYHGTTASNQTVVLPGRGGGTATLGYQGTLASGAWSTTYAGYSEDGATFLDGSLGASRTSAGVWRITGTVTVRGAHTGKLAADLTIGPADPATGLPTKAGGITTTYDGKMAAPLPALAACPSRLPRRSPVVATARRVGGGVRVTVTATIAGERRPVAGAIVRLGARRATTGAAGSATLRASGRAGGTVTVDAGDTFRPARTRVRG